MVLGGAMLVLGLAIAIFGIYELSFADGSWKWIVAIPDGLFAAFTGFAILHYARNRTRPSEQQGGTFAALTAPVTNLFRRGSGRADVDERDGEDSDSLAAADRPHPLIRRRLDRHGHSYYGTEPAPDRGLVGSELGLLADDRHVDVDRRAA